MECVSSATLDATSFLDYFTSDNSPDEATIISLEGRMYPVEVAYLQEPTPDYVRKAAETVWSIHMQQTPGDILVFLTGREEIERCLEELAEYLPTYVSIESSPASSLHTFTKITSRRASAKSARSPCRSLDRRATSRFRARGTRDAQSDCLDKHSRS